MSKLYTEDQFLRIFGGIIATALKEMEKLEPVQIVRCKDCKWCSEHYDTDGNAPYWICRNWDVGRWNRCRWILL